MLADPTAVTDVVVVVVVEVTGEVRKSSDTMLELSAGLTACAFSGVPDPGPVVVTTRPSREVCAPKVRARTEITANVEASPR